MKKIYVLGLLSAFSMSSFAAELSEKQKTSIKEIIQLFKAKDINKISEIVQYPLKREIPLPEIKDPKEMKSRFNQVFDTTLQNKIAQSKLSDWSQVGWRGVMFDQGEMWITNIDDAEHPKAGAKITAVNYSSRAEQTLAKQALAAQKQKLHSSLRSFERPDLLFKTKDYLVRIDEMSSGKYRYAAWKNSQDQSKKPDLVLNNGTLKMEGSGGNHTFQFKSGDYRYNVERQIIGGESDADDAIRVEQNGKTVLLQEGYIVAY